MKVFNRGEGLPESPFKPSEGDDVLPTSRGMLERAGMRFNFFIDSFEGPQIELDEEGIRNLAEGARRRVKEEKHPD